MGSLVGGSLIFSGEKWDARGRDRGEPPKWRYSNRLLQRNLSYLPAGMTWKCRFRVPEQTSHNFTLHRAAVEEIDAAWRIIEEYYGAARVVARDSRDDFARLYFGDGSGVWIASQARRIIGCIALRPLRAFAASGEVKRLYVQPSLRGRGIAAALYQALQTYAQGFGYRWLYLDTTDEMTAAMRFYEGLGYERCARYNDNPQATIFMRKELKVSRF
jgi:GNAT superfamily N-acetyltransferase